MSAPAHESYELAEGLRLVGRRLVFVDILAGRLHETATELETPATVLFDLDLPLGAVAPVAGRPGTWIAAVGDGIGLLTPGSGTITWISRPERTAATPMRMNDGVCDPVGRFWAGSMAYDSRERAGSLYRVDSDLRVTRVLDGITIPNGPAFSPDGTTMYLADSARGVITAYDVDPSRGGLERPRTFAEIPGEDGAPDGMTVDADGGLWVALWGGARVRRFTATGRIAEDVSLKAAQPTSPCLVPGPDGTYLTVATARYGLDRPGDADGSLCRRPVRARALAASAFVSTVPARQEPPQPSGPLSEPPM